MVTALRDGVKHAMTATAVSSVSLEPPLILVCVSRQQPLPHGDHARPTPGAVACSPPSRSALARHFSNRGRDLLTQFDDVAHAARAGQRHRR